MAHYAQLDSNNIIVQVIKLEEDDEAVGVQWCKDNIGGVDWKKTSYNTRKNVHKQGKTPFRKNFATIGAKFDKGRDAFIPPKQYKSWDLNEDTGEYEPPTPHPDDGKSYKWNDVTLGWEEKV